MDPPLCRTKEVVKLIDTDNTGEEVGEEEGRERQTYDVRRRLNFGWRYFTPIHLIFKRDQVCETLSGTLAHSRHTTLGRAAVAFCAG